MNTLLNLDVESLIPFFAIFFVFMIPIMAIYFHYQHKQRQMDERKLMIEKGLTPPPLPVHENNYQWAGHKSQNLGKGLNMIAIALGLMVGYLLSKYLSIRGPFCIIGGILFFLGLANVVNAMITKKESSNENKAETNIHQSQIENHDTI
jgi:uncharacterized membrane protein YfcA